MIELKKLEKKKRILLSAGCVSHFISYKKNNAFKDVYDEIIRLAGEKYTKEAWTIVTACSKAVRYGTKGCHLSIRQANYTTANKITKQKVSYTRMKQLISLLDDVGFLVLYKGFYNSPDDYAKTMFVMCESLYQRMLPKAKQGACVEADELVVFKDDNGKVIHSHKKKGVKAIRDGVEVYNSMMAKHKVTLEGNTLVPLFKRVYGDCLTKAGRWYSMNSLQTIKSEERKNILIDGSRTVEWDYSATHPSICAELTGMSVPASFCPYDVKVNKIQGSKVEQRNLFKTAMMCMLYTGDVTSAQRAITSKTVQDKKKDKERKYDSLVFTKGWQKETLHALQEHNKHIEEYFYSSTLWKTLQNKDSDIAAYIINKFVEIGIPILPYHDSFRVREEDEDMLTALMFEAWKEILGTNNACKIDEK